MIFSLNVDELSRRWPVSKDTNAGRMQPDVRQPLRLRIRQRPQKQRVHNTEDRTVRADADGQREHHHRSQARVFAQHAQRVEKILQHGYLLKSKLFPAELLSYTARTNPHPYSNERPASPDRTTATE